MSRLTTLTGHFILASVLFQHPTWRTKLQWSVWSDFNSTIIMGQNANISETSLMHIKAIKRLKVLTRAISCWFLIFVILCGQRCKGFGLGLNWMPRVAVSRSCQATLSDRCNRWQSKCYIILSQISHERPMWPTPAVRKRVSPSIPSETVSVVSE